MFTVFVNAIMSTELFVVGAEHDLENTAVIDAHTIIGETFVGMEIEHEQKTGPFECNHFVILVLQRDVTLLRNKTNTKWTNY